MTDVAELLLELHGLLHQLRERLDDVASWQQEVQTSEWLVEQHGDDKELKNRLRYSREMLAAAEREANETKQRIVCLLKDVASEVMSWSSS